MLHAIFVAFHFPPEASSSGVLRTLKFVRYLADHDWRVTVIAPTVQAYEVCDPSLEVQLPASTRIVRTPWLNTKRHLSVGGRYPALLALPDNWIGWFPWAVATGRRILRSEGADLVFSTSPHATAHLIAWRLARAGGLPWVADFRDPWIEDPPEPGAPNGPVYRRLNRWLERRVIERCDAVVVSTNQLRDTLRSRYPAQPSGKIRSILNGYDEMDFAALPPAAPPGRRLRIVHAGSINAEFRDPVPMFQALGNMIRSGIAHPAEFEIRFIGGGPYAQAQRVHAAIAAAGLEGSVVFLPRVPYDESLRELGAADVLLLLQASADTVDLVPAKLYEYLRSQKPVLALVYPGAVTDVMARTGGGWSADPRTPALEATLAEIVADWRDGRLGSRAASLDALRCFDRRALTAELAGVFRTLVGDASGRH